MNRMKRIDVGEGFVASEDRADRRDDPIGAESEVVEVLQHVLERIFRQPINKQATATQIHQSFEMFLVRRLRDGPENRRERPGFLGVGPHKRPFLLGLQVFQLDFVERPFVVSPRVQIRIAPVRSERVLSRGLPILLVPHLVAL